MNQTTPQVVTPNIYVINLLGEDVDLTQCSNCGEHYDCSCMEVDYGVCQDCLDLGVADDWGYEADVL
jgi:hypothetical protein